jgi:hypothetical protein
MLGFLDIRSLSLMAGLNSITLACVMLYMSVSRVTYPGFHRWTLAFVAGGIGMVLISLRHLAPDWLSIVIANSCVFLFAVLLPDGLEAFLESPRRWWLTGGSALVAVALLSYFTLWQPDLTARIVIVSAEIGLMMAYSAVLLLQKGRQRLGSGNVLLNLIFSFLAMWLLFRAVLTPLLENQSADFMRSSTLQSLSFIVYALGCLATMGGLITLNAQRMENELASADRKIETLTQLVPICSSCKKIRDSHGNWQAVEHYIQDRTDDDLSHSICPECAAKLYPDLDIYGDD